MKAGSIILVYSKGFLPDQIRAHMAMYARQTGREPSRWNHAETVIEYRGRLVSMGARAKGAEMSPLYEYLKDHPDHLILEPLEPLTDHEIMTLEDYADDVCFRRKRKYQYGMFLAWVHYIKSWGLWQWIGKGDKRVYCFELSARCAALISRWRHNRSLNLVSIYDLLENPDYKPIN